MKKFQLIFLCILMIAICGCGKKEEPEEMQMMEEPREMEITSFSFTHTGSSTEQCFLYSAEQTEELFAGQQILYSDYKAVISLNRSNGGLTYINDGIVVKKWGRRNYPAAYVGNILAEDPEIITATTQIDERLFAEISLFVILFLIVIIRFFSKIIYNGRKSAVTS